MNKLKIGDVVTRKSYRNDVLFEIVRIIRISNNKHIAILKGITQRIEADSYIEDLQIVDKKIIDERMKLFDSKISNYIEEYKENRSDKEIYTGTILHLDGDRRYSEKSIKYYKSLGLNAIVKNIPENRQPQMVYSLLSKYEPDILVITGHDGMIKKGTGFNDIYNYRNSKYFVSAVREARNWRNDLAIFAGACQSYYEAIMSAGANFASSPARIMIDFIDPLIVAERIATTDNSKYLTIRDIEDELRDGRKGIDGIGTMGRKMIKL